MCFSFNLIPQQLRKGLLLLPFVHGRMEVQRDHLLSVVDKYKVVESEF